MHVLLHTIALEPARWLPQKVTTPLVGLLPHIAAAGFPDLEIYEPHLASASASDEQNLADAFAAHGLTPVVLSSYLDLSPAFHPDEPFAAQSQALLDRVDRFGFRKVRLFPGRSPSPEDVARTMAGVAARIRRLADARPHVEFLLETHDGTLADHPPRMLQLLDACARPNVGLLWQPTVFEPAAAEAQFAVQKAAIRHFHLQNRAPDGGFARLEKGVIPWGTFLRGAGFLPDVTLEFVPSGICPPDRFDLPACLAEAVEERTYVRALAARA